MLLKIYIDFQYLFTKHSFLFLNLSFKKSNLKILFPAFHIFIFYNLVINSQQKVTRKLKTLRYTRLIHWLAE